MEAGWPKTFHDLQLYQKASHHAKFGEDTTSGSLVVGFFVQKTSVFHPPFEHFLRSCSKNFSTVFYELEFVFRISSSK